MKRKVSVQIRYAEVLFLYHVMQKSYFFIMLSGYLNRYAVIAVIAPILLRLKYGICYSGFTIEQLSCSGKWFVT